MIEYIVLKVYGGVSEWTIVAVLKTAEVTSLRGFESHPLRQMWTGLASRAGL